MLRRFGKVAMALLLVAGVLIPTAGAGAGVARAAAPAESSVSMDPYYFPQTQHYLSGRFRQYWEAHGGLLTFGYPLTNVFDAVSTNGKTYKTQYFERAIFEYHPENPQPYDVLLTLIGDEITKDRRSEAPFQPAAPINDANHSYFPETQHNLGWGFRNYWLANGGLQNFGYPLSEEFQEKSPENGQVYTVQYFERARFEYHPENKNTPYETLLGHLGRERMARVGVPASATAPETSPPTGDQIPGGGGAPSASGLQYGFNVFLIGNAPGATYNSQILQKVQGAGFGWVRIQLVWSDFEPVKGQYDWGPLDTRINAINAAGLKVLLSVAKSPAWAAPDRPGGLPEDTDGFYNTMRLISGRYTTKIQAYEIWNEENLAGETGGNVTVAPYFETLKAGYKGVKKNNPNAIVVFGGLTPTGVMDPTIAIDDTKYLEAFYAYNNGEGKQYYDVLGAHPGSAANAPDTSFPANPGTGNCPPVYANLQGTCWRNAPDFYFRRVEDQRAVMVANGEGNKQIWLTEFGWDSCQGLPAPKGYEYCLLTSEQQQAQYIVQAYQMAKSQWPWMGAMFLWNLNYQTIPGIAQGDEKYGWGVLRPDLSPRPAYTAIQQMPK
jgi:hypothetical protein